MKRNIEEMTISEIRAYVEQLEAQAAITAEKVEQFKGFYNKRCNDESRKSDAFNSGAIAALQCVSIIFGVEL